MSNLKRLLLTMISLCAARGLYAQETVNKGDVTIHIYVIGSSIFEKCFMNVYKKGNEVKIDYARLDSIKLSEIRKDPAYRILRDHRIKTSPNDPKSPLITDSITRLIDQHSAYTRYSTTVNLKQDTVYKNMLIRISKASRAQLQQKKTHPVMDGDSETYTIITHAESKIINASSPTPDELPLLYKLFQSSFDLVKDNGNSDKKQR